MSFKNNILEAIGNTPIVKLNQIPQGVKGDLYAKCEFLNPGGSIKDRIGYYMLDKAVEKGLLKPGGTVVEGTSGNTGVGLAIACTIKGFQAVFVLPDKMSEEKRQNLRAFGAKVVITPTAVPPESPESYYSVARRLAREIPNAFYVNQYDNLTNRETHYKMTGPEIWKQTEGKIDSIVIGMGTCGTISGIGKYIKEQNPKVKIIGVDPKGSILKDLFDTGKIIEAKSYLIEGIGEDIVPKNCDFTVIDQIIRVEDKESFLMTRKLLTKEGIFSGISSGAAVVGALRYMSQSSEPERVLVILPDSGNRYLSKVYNDAWMMENGFLEPTVDHTVKKMVSALHRIPLVISVTSSDSIEKTVRTMKEASVSQLPVFKGKELVGVISETDLLRPLFLQDAKPTDAIEKWVSKNYSILQETDDISRLHDIFTANKVAFVASGSEIKYVLTMIDLISYLSFNSRT